MPDRSYLIEFKVTRDDGVATVRHSQCTLSFTAEQMEQAQVQGAMVAAATTQIMRSVAEHVVTAVASEYVPEEPQS